MAKEMLINVSEGEECRIALVEDGVLEELYMERQSSTSHVNNIYKGRVMNVEPSIQAAFVDFGLGRNGFLHISDLLPTYFGHKGEDIQEAVGRKMSRRDRPPIQRCLRRGDELLVQVIKEGIGTKGPTLSTYLSIPGKILVMMPGMVSKGVSRKIEDDEERRRLRQILDQLDPPDDCGFIIRTAGVGKSKVEIERDLKYLARLWETIKKKRDNEPAPVELYIEGDLVTRTVRDLFSSDVDHLVIDNKQVAERVQEVIKLANPRAKNRVDLYEEPMPLFHKYGIEAEIEQMYSRHVPLRSGGSLVIDSTEAIVAIDVNSGKFRDHSDAETTAFKIDMEAADEICRQLKLRDLGGVIICDFIDLRYERHRRELEERLHENLKRDRAKTKVLRMSQFGIIEMTRQRMRPSLKRSVYFDCPHCKGAGLVKTPESMGLDVMRRLAIAICDARVVRVELSVNSDVSFYLLNKKRSGLAQLEYDTGKSIVIRGDAKLGLDEMRLDLFDNRDGVVVINELASASKSVPHKTQLNTRPQPVPQRGGRGAKPEDRRPGQRPPQQKPRHGHHDDEEEGREDFDREVAAIEDRTEDFEREPEDSGAPSPDVAAAGEEHAEVLHDDHDEIGPAPEGDQEDRDRALRDNRDNRDNRGRPPRDNRNDRGPGRRDNRNDRGPEPRDYRNDRPDVSGDRDTGGTAPRDNRGPAPRDNRNDRRPAPSNDRDNRPMGRDNRGPAPRDNRGPAPRDNRSDRRPPPVDNRDNRPAPGDDRAGEPPQRDLEEVNGAVPQNNHEDFEPQEGEGGGKRRRRRRRRRGRGRGGQQGIQDGQPIPQGQRDDNGPPLDGNEDFRGEPVGEVPDDQGDREGADEGQRGEPLGDRQMPEDATARGAREGREDVMARGAREDREDRDFDRELRDIHSRAADDAEARADGHTPESDERAEHSQIVESSAQEAVSRAEPDNEESSAAEAGETANAGETPKRGRGPGGRGGRGRGGKKAEAKPAAKAKTSSIKASAKSAVSEADAESEEKPKKSGAPRGVKGRGKKAATPKSGGSETSTDAGKSTPASSDIPQTPVVRTGSTDKHLADDEPVLDEPVRRPRSVRDLDHIPDDYD